MNLKYLFFFLVLLSLSIDAKGQALDTDNSIVSFSVKNMRFNTVEGSFSKMTGDIVFNTDNLAASTFDVCIDASTIDTGNAKRDKHLRNEDFFDVDVYPTICFKSTQLVKTSAGYKTTGTLTMHGITKTIEIPFTYSNNEFVGNFKVDRFDYKIGEGTGKFMVGKEINIEIIAKLKH